jgi:hypothetical protein
MVLGNPHNFESFCRQQSSASPGGFRSGRFHRAGMNRDATLRAAIVLRQRTEDALGASY